LHDAADEARSWNKPPWLDLLHYRRSGFDRHAFTSGADDERFFYAPRGRTDPRAELHATLAALFGDQAAGNGHALCRFPARTRWLQQELGIDPGRLPKPVCSDFSAWRDHVRAASATLVFPTFQLNSPSSMFGHTLLRLDPAEGENWSEWLSYAVNFGADITADDNSFAYAWKGLTGGYPGQYLVMPYFRKIREYNRIEKRDIWEYNLSLTPAEVDRLVNHLWELKGINFEYLFITKNCSYRLLELLEVARPSLDLTDRFVLSAIPVDTIRAVWKAGLIESARFRPSQQTIAKRRIATMPEQDYGLLDSWLHDPIDESDARFQALSPLRRQRLIDAAYRVLRIRQAGRARDPDIAKKSHRLLAMLTRYPTVLEPPVPVPARPDTGHHSKRATFGVLDRNGRGYAEVGLRLAYHSLEDNELGYLRGAQINIGAVTLRRQNSSGKTVLQRLDLVDIVSLTSRSRFFHPLSWRVRGGVERVYSGGADRAVGQVSGGAGFTSPFLRNGDVYTLLTARLEANSTFATWVEPALGAAAGAMYHSRVGTGRMELNSEIFAGGEFRSNAVLVQNLVMARDHALQIRWKREWHNHDAFNEVSLNYNYFFQ